MPERPAAAGADGRPVGPVRRVVAVVVSWRQVEQLAGCLAALDAQTHPQLDVVVVDNASGDGSVEVAQRAAAAVRSHPVTVVANATNRGFTGGVHDGLAVAEQVAPGWDGVWLVNVDCEPEPDHLARLVATLDDHPACGAAQGRLLRTEPAPDGGTIVDSTGIELTTARLVRDRDEGRRADAVTRPAQEVFGVTGACALLRRAALEDVAWPGPGLWTARVLTEPLFAYFDDVDLAWRLRRHGWTARHVPDAVAHHERGGAGPRRSAFVEELNAANRLLVVRTCDVRRRGGRAAVLVAVTTALKLVDLLVSHPAAARRAAVRWWRGRDAADRRRAALEVAQRVTAEAVVERWAVPFRFGPWIATWWRRVTGRPPGVRRPG